MQRRVVVTGVGAVSPCGATMNSTWASLVDGISGIGRTTGFEVDDFRCRVSGQCRDFSAEAYLDPKTLRHTGRFIHMAIAASQMAVDHAGLDTTQGDGKRGGVLIGVGVASLDRIVDTHVVITEQGARRVPPFFVPSAITNMAAGQVALRFHLRGPSFSPASACTSGAHAIGTALDLIRAGRADFMLAGGAEANVTRVALAGFDAMRAMSTHVDPPEGACRPFDRDRDGFVLSEGAAVLVLEEYEHARKRGAPILCELRGYGATTDAHHAWHPAPEGEGLADAIELALADARLPIDHVGYVNAHATATPAGDLAEAQAIAKSFGTHAREGLWVSSTKSMTGHLLGASGALEAAISVMALTRGVVPPTLNLSHADPGIEGRLDLVARESRERTLRAVVSNSTGFGGHNAVLVFATA